MDGWVGGWTMDDVVDGGWWKRGEFGGRRRPSLRWISSELRVGGRWKMEDGRLEDGELTGSEQLQHGT